MVKSTAPPNETGMNTTMSNRDRMNQTTTTVMTSNKRTARISLYRCCIVVNLTFPVYMLSPLERSFRELTLRLFAPPLGCPDCDSAVLPVKKNRRSNISVRAGNHMQGWRKGGDLIF
jgi:hypothetical protein